MSAPGRPGPAREGFILGAGRKGAVPILFGTVLLDTDVPDGPRISVIVRDEVLLPVSGATRIEAGDRLMVLAEPGLRAAVETVFV